MLLADLFQPVDRFAVEFLDEAMWGMAAAGVAPSPKQLLGLCRYELP